MRSFITSDERFERLVNLDIELTNLSRLMRDRSRNKNVLVAQLAAEYLMRPERVLEIVRDTNNCDGYE